MATIDVHPPVFKTRSVPGFRETDDRNAPRARTGVSALLPGGEQDEGGSSRECVFAE